MPLPTIGGRVLKPRRVAAGLGLRAGDRRRSSGRHDVGQPAFLLLVGAEAGDTVSPVAIETMAETASDWSARAISSMREHGLEDAEPHAAKLLGRTGST